LTEEDPAWIWSEVVVRFKLRMMIPWVRLEARLDLVAQLNSTTQNLEKYD
jgi:hypothetical protein